MGVGLLEGVEVETGAGEDVTGVDIGTVEKLDDNVNGAEEEDIIGMEVDTGMGDEDTIGTDVDTGIGDDVTGTEDELAANPKDAIVSPSGVSGA